MSKVLRIISVFIIIVTSFSCEVREKFTTTDSKEYYNTEDLDKLKDIMVWDTNELDNEEKYFECNFKHSNLKLLFVGEDGVLLSNSGRLMKIKESGEIVLDRVYLDSEEGKRLDILFLSSVSDGGYIAIFSSKDSIDDVDSRNYNYYIVKLSNSFDIEWAKQLERYIETNSTVLFTVYSIASLMNLGEDRYGVILIGYARVFIGEPGTVDIYRKLYIIIDKNGKVELGRFFGSDADARRNYIFDLIPVNSPENGYLMISDEYDDYNYGDDYRQSCVGDIYITKLDKNGDIIWKKAYNYWYADRYVFDYNILRISGSGYIIGGGMGYIGEDRKGYFILKIDEDGNIIKSIGYNLYNKEGREIQKKLDFGISFIENNNKRGEYVLSGLYSRGLDEGEYFVIMNINEEGKVKWVYNNERERIKEEIDCTMCNCNFDPPYLASFFSGNYLYMRGYRVYCGDKKVGESSFVKNISNNGYMCDSKFEKNIKINEGYIDVGVSECEKIQKGVDVNVGLKNIINKFFVRDYNDNICSICKNR